MISSERLDKRRRKRWVEMLHQLRYGSKVAPEVLPGNCQDMLDWLLAREWPFDGPAPRPRDTTHRLTRHTATAAQLLAVLPPWAQHVEREPGSDDGYPIFYLARGVLIYLDGRRRINAWHRQDPGQPVTYWMISDEI